MSKFHNLYSWDKKGAEHPICLLILFLQSAISLKMFCTIAKISHYCGLLSTNSTRTNSTSEPKQISHISPLEYKLITRVHGAVCIKLRTHMQGRQEEKSSRRWVNHFATCLVCFLFPVPNKHCSQEAVTDLEGNWSNEILIKNTS